MQKLTSEHLFEHAFSRERDLDERDEHIDADVRDAERFQGCEPEADEEDEDDGE